MTGRAPSNLSSCHALLLGRSFFLKLLKKWKSKEGNSCFLNTQTRVTPITSTYIQLLRASHVGTCNLDVWHVGQCSPCRGCTFLQQLYTREGREHAWGLCPHCVRCVASTFKEPLPEQREKVHRREILWKRWHLRWSSIDRTARQVGKRGIQLAWGH